jgi:exodeoxyribonuclease VII large subunit
MATGMERFSLSVSEVTRRVKDRLETDSGLRDIWIEGEISNWVRSRAGHCYFTLKDARAAIRAVMWRSTAGRLAFSPQDGQAVRAHGYVSVYEPQGQYQFYVDDLQSTGQGALYLEYEALKARLAAEGLFDAERKRPLPETPSCIGVVTSPTGAALRDILNVLERRWPLVQVLLAPTLVQGERAPAQIVAALQSLYAHVEAGREPKVDLIIVARGGGSIEDLWAFNDEDVGRAIVVSPVPVISGVGHEIDFTISDFCADLRAPTPSAAAEVAVPDRFEIEGQLAAMRTTLEDLWNQRLAQRRGALDLRRQVLARLSPRGRVEANRQRVDELGRRLERAERHRRSLLREQAAGLRRRLEGLDPLAILGRGFALVRRADGSLVRSASKVVTGERVDVRVSDGEFGAQVVDVDRGSG